MVGIGRWARQHGKHTLAALLALFALAGVAVAIYETHSGDPGEQALQAAKAVVSHPVYYPKRLPSGYYYKTGSMKAGSGVVVFVIAGPQNQQIVVTEQAKPKGYDFSQLSGTVEFQAPLGSAYVEDFDNRTTGSIVTDQTWIITNTYTPIGADIMREILSSFQ